MTDHIDTSIKSGRIKQILWNQTSPLSEMMPSCQFSPRVSKVSILTNNRYCKEPETLCAI
jgi:hypothetical protein